MLIKYESFTLIEINWNVDFFLSIDSLETINLSPNIRYWSIWSFYVVPNL
jgi:hypothetical protein